MKKVVVIATMLVTLVALASAWPLLIVPIVNPDHLSLNPTCPYLGRVVYARPNSNWNVNFNDEAYNTGPNVNGDFDFNDANVQVNFAYSFILYNSSTTENTNLVSINYGPWLSVGQSAKFDIPLNGQPVEIRMWNTTKGTMFVSGPASGNFDNTVHAWTYCGIFCGTK